MSELMKKVYYNPSDTGSLGGKERLKQGVLQEYGVALKNKDVTDWLAAQDVYTLHRTAPVKYKRIRQERRSRKHSIPYSKKTECHKNYRLIRAPNSLTNIFSN